MALGHGEDDSLAKQRLSQHAFLIGVAVIEHLAEFPHDGAVAFGDGESPFQGRRVNDDALLVPEQLFKLGAGLGVHGRPVKLSRLTSKPPSAAVLTVRAL